jgi:transposase-like protein
MADRKSISEAARHFDINRNTLSRWVKAGKLKTQLGIVDGRPSVLVDMAAVAKLVGTGVAPGRPKKTK